MCRVQRGFFLAILLLSSTLSAHAQIDTAVVGRLEILVTDTARGAEYEYSLKTAEGSRVRLEFQHGRPAHARAGVMLRARGTTRPDGTLVVGDSARVQERAIQSNALLPRAESLLVLIGHFAGSNPPCTKAAVELITKVLDARSINNRYWIYTGALSDVAYTVMYTNTRTGRWVRIQNPAGNYCGSATDMLN
jgi:hypothetical protein